MAAGDLAGQVVNAPVGGSGAVRADLVVAVLRSAVGADGGWVGQAGVVDGAFGLAALNTAANVLVDVVAGNEVTWCEIVIYRNF